MTITVHVECHAADRPPAGASIRIEARDISVADEMPEVVGAATTTVEDGSSSRHLATVHMAISRRPQLSTLWVHVDVDGDGRVSVGDLVSTQSVPLPADEGEVHVLTARVEA